MITHQNRTKSDTKCIGILTSDLFCLKTIHAYLRLEIHVVWGEVFFV